MTPVDIYISLNSPWTYMAWERLHEIATRRSLAVTVKPAKFAEVFAATGGLPLPKRAPERQAYRMMEMKRWRDRLGLPMVLQPRAFPSDEGPGVRLVIAAMEQGQDAARFAQEIGRALWEHDQSIADAAVLDAAAVRAGLDLASLRARSRPDVDLDAVWTANTAEAVRRGVFGAPSVVLPDGEIFWGQDRVELLDWRLSQPRKA
jgi:2-hydroxychromene-2-carboxylate isomerase